MILFLVRLVRFLVILFIVRLALRFVVAVIQGYRNADNGKSRPSTATTSAATTLVRDHVCDTFLPRSSALVATVGGREQHFCSPACRDRALRLAP